MTPVLLETNWVVDVCAPTYRRERAAMHLLDRAAIGELELHVPAIAFREAADVIKRKHVPSQAKVLQEFRRWAHATELIDGLTSVVTSEFLNQFVSHTNTALANVSVRLDEVASAPGVHVFALSEPMLERALALRQQVDNLGPFDEAILAAVLVRAESLRDGGPIFCTRDRDLSPLTRQGEPRAEFVQLYAEAGLTVRTDFQIPLS